MNDALPYKRSRDAASVLMAKVAGYDSGDQLSELTLGSQKLLVAGRAGAVGTLSASALPPATSALRHTIRRRPRYSMYWQAAYRQH